MTDYDNKLKNELTTSINGYIQDHHQLPGIQNKDAFEVFLCQLIESSHRFKYLTSLGEKKWSSDYADPKNELFNPYKAASYNNHNQNFDEAYWLVFLSTHFGRHRISGWHFVKSIYGNLGEGEYWSWNNIKNNLEVFRKWLDDNIDTIKPQIGLYGFGNHRKYESLNPYSRRGTGAVISSYVEWINSNVNHSGLFQCAQELNALDPQRTFDYVFRTMTDVIGFGRTGRYDYLSTVGLLGIANIKPGSLYLPHSTGPLSGARLLLGGTKNSIMNIDELNLLVNNFTKKTQIEIWILEDALCNWQKSPTHFVKFRG